MPELIYCAGKNKRYAETAIAAGFRYGAQLPCTTYGPVWFADQDWKSHSIAWMIRSYLLRFGWRFLEPLLAALAAIAQNSRSRYMAALAAHKPEMATVLDLERPAQLSEVLSWAEEASQYCNRVLIIPKYSGAVDSLPRQIGNADVVLAYSVPTAFGGTSVPVWEFSGWPVHLLGGSPHRQMVLTHYFDVVSCDGNMANKMSHAGRFWSATKGPKGHWRNLREIGIDLPTDNNLEAFRLSCENIMRTWKIRSTHL